MYKNVFLWKDGVRIRPMSEERTQNYIPSSLNVSRVMSRMLPSDDVELMCKKIATAVRISHELGESDAELSNRIYNAMMEESNREDL